MLAVRRRPTRYHRSARKEDVTGIEEMEQAAPAEPDEVERAAERDEGDGKAQNKNNRRSFRVFLSGLGLGLTLAGGALVWVASDRSVVLPTNVRL